MLFPLNRILDEDQELLCVHQDQTVREALSLMVENDFSQLPILTKTGKLVGLINEETIIRRYFFSEGEVLLLDLTVDQCQTPVRTISFDRDIFDALELLKDSYAIVVIDDNNQPMGILTDYDMATWFHELTGDLLIIEDIETSLRQIYQSILTDEDDSNQSLKNAFGAQKDDPSQPRITFEQLSFGQLIRTITHDENWGNFQEVFQPREMFHQFMEQVRKNRNQLAHFRGRLDRIQHNALIETIHWLESRPFKSLRNEVQVREIDTSKIDRLRERREGKYSPLRDWLEIQKGSGVNRFQVEFKDIEELLGEKLPDSARNHRAWWGNHYSEHGQARAWLNAGFLVDGVDFETEIVEFRMSRTALYPGIFFGLLQGTLKARPGITQASRHSLDNWFSFSSGVPGFQLGWSLPKEPVLRVDLYIDTGDYEINKKAFDKLHATKSDIESSIGCSLNWERLDDARACRIAASKSFDINGTHEEIQETIEWGIDMMLKFIDAFQGRLRKIAGND
jgi:CBS domain-containing protein